MAIFYVAHQGTILTKKGERILIKKSNKVISWIFGKEIEELILIGNVSITPQAIKYFLENGIDVIFLSFYGKYRGKLVSTPGKNIFLRIGQFNLFQNEKFKLEFAKRCVRVKLANYIKLLRRRNYKLRNETITTQIRKIRNVLTKVNNGKNIDEVRGYEGIGSKYYFNSLKEILAPTEFEFTKRTRRPPRDEVNALMSFYYTVMGNRITSTLNKVGLDPYLGTLHTVEYGRPSLTLDLLEQYRPFIDNLIITAINKKIIKKTDFHVRQDYFPIIEDEEELEQIDEEDYPVLLTHSGLKTAIHYLEVNLSQKRFFEPIGLRIDINKIIEEQARSIIRFIEGKDLDFYDFEVI